MQNVGSYKMLGKEVTVKVDRPLGSLHPKHKDILYTVNYGYIEGIISEYDNEELDAYILGVDEVILMVYQLLQLLLFLTSYNSQHFA